MKDIEYKRNGIYAPWIREAKEGVMGKEDKKVEIKVGNVVKCRLSGIQDYGAFVYIKDGVSGLILYSEITGEKYGKKNIEAALGGKTEFEAMVTEIKGDGKISLSLKKAVEQRSKEEVAQQLKDMNGEEKSIREIWKIIIDINKCLLQYMRQPIRLLPETCKIDKKTGRMTVDIDEESKSKIFAASLKDRYAIEVERESSSEWSFAKNIDELAGGGEVEECRIGLREYVLHVCAAGVCGRHGLRI